MLRRTSIATLVAVIFLGLLGLVAPARAQPEAAASDAVACLTPPAAVRNRLDYPPDALAGGVTGTTVVEMEFTSPADPPKVTMVHTSDPRLDRAVAEHVGNYRVPCLRPGERARLQQEFSFVPNPAGVVAATHAIDLRPADIPRCLTHLGPNSHPEWPTRFTGTAMHGIESHSPTVGVILARMRFTSADGPPAVTFPDEQKDSAFRQPVEDWVRDYRFTCYDGEPFVATQLFRFGVPSKLLNDMSLVNFLRNVKLADQKQYFELDRMRCPFTVRFEYMQPFLPNRVQEVGARAPGRQAFLDWLSTLRFDVEPKRENILLGQSLNIAVPCGKISL